MSAAVHPGPTVPVASPAAPMPVGVHTAGPTVPVASPAGAAAREPSSPVAHPENRRQEPPDADIEGAARRRFQSGEQFYAGGRFTQALRDFEAILATMPESGLADDAALRIAEYRFDHEADPVAAAAVLDRLFADFPGGDAVPGAHYLLGRIAAASVPPRPEEAVAEFERAAGAAGPDGSRWSFPALVGAARVRLAWMEDDLAAEALSAALYDRAGGGSDAGGRAEARFLLIRAFARAGACDAAFSEAATLRADLQRAARASGGPPDPLLEPVSDLISLCEFAGEGRLPTYRALGAIRPPERFQDVRRIRFSGGRIHALDRGASGVRSFSPSGEFAGGVEVRDSWSLAADREASSVVVAAGRRIVLDGNAFQLRVDGGELRRIRAVALAPGEIWAYDDRRSQVLRFARSGLFLGPRPHPRVGDVRVIERHPAGHLVMVDDRFGLGVLDADGAVLLHEPRGGSLSRPADVAFDDLGRLYVLDRETPAVAVFDRSLRPLAPILQSTFRDAGIREPVALDVGPDGALYVFDDATRAIWLLR